MRHTFQALVFEQNGHEFFITTATNSTLPKNTVTDLYSLDHTTGYQRSLDERRGTEYGKHIEENTSPRTILLNVRKPARITRQGKGRIAKISVPDTVYNVDGQHLRYGVEVRKNPALFEVPIIFSNLDREEESRLFRVMNIAAVKLASDIEQQVTAAAEDELWFDVLPEKMAKKAVIIKPATKITNALTKNPNTVWFKRITLATMAHDRNHRRVKQSTFVTSLAQNVFKYNRNLTWEEGEKIVTAMWEGAALAWVKCAEDLRMYSLISMMGVGVLHRLLGRLIPKLRGTPYIKDKNAYRDILLASGMTDMDWATGNPEARIGSQLGTNRVVYEHALQLMLKGIEKDWPKYLPAFKTPKVQKKADAKISKTTKQRKGYDAITVKDGTAYTHAAPKTKRAAAKRR